MEKSSQIFCDELRFADGKAYWIYRFQLGKNTRAEMRIDIQNQFRASLSSSEMKFPLSCLVATDDCELKRDVPSNPFKGERSLSSYDVEDTLELYKLENSEISGKICFFKDIGKGKLYFFSLKRGPYIIAYSYADELVFKGEFINIFSPDIQLEREHIVKPGEWCLLRDVSEKMTAGHPSLLWTSSKLNFLRENEKELKMLLSGPEGAEGVSRVFLGRRNHWRVEAVDELGNRVEVDVQREGETLLLRYKNKESGIAIRIIWR